MNLYALSALPLENARFHADIHLRPTITSISKIVSDSFHHAQEKGLIPGGSVGLRVKKKDDLTYWINECQILPPSRNPSVWSKWGAMNRINLWWMVDFSFNLNKEMKERFGHAIGDHRDYLKVQEWAAGGIVGGMFPIPSAKTPATSLRDEFPLSVPSVEVLKLGEEVIHKPVEKIYQAYYASRKGYFRMRWTGRARPLFMLPDDEPDPVSTQEAIPF